MEGDGLGWGLVPVWLEGDEMGVGDGALPAEVRGWLRAPLLEVAGLLVEGSFLHLTIFDIIWKTSTSNC